MIQHETKSRDTISWIATVGAPAYVGFRILTGGWTSLAFFAILWLSILAFYWFILANEPLDGSSSSRPID